ncbi:methyltransferase [Massilia sp. DWR3-1-1]|uniref:methyltransferase n=1 Tax=Massilia sp. DWR3-1-1 TaxID=2804559 RepID=UPI003CF3EAA1
MTSFVNQLIAACQQPIKEAVFLEGYRAVLEQVATPGSFVLHGLQLDAGAGVYSPHDTSSTRFFADHFEAAGLLQGKGRRFLEVGCGAGAIALLAARCGWQAHAGDIDAAAVAATAANARANALAVDVRQSDLFSAFSGETFDVIAFNPPFFHVDRDIAIEERTLSDSGGSLFQRFMQGAGALLAPGGCIVVTFSNCSNPAVFDDHEFDMALLAFDFDGTANYIRAMFKATRPA